MEDVLIEYKDTVVGEDGRSYRASAVGAERANGMWDGWIDFVPMAAGAGAVRSPRETTQPNRMDLLYWATGLSHAYLEGALTRALTHARTDSGSGVADGARSAGSSAAASATGAAAPLATGTAPPRLPPLHGAVLDPFTVYAEGADLLDSQLGALNGDQLRGIVREYQLSNLSNAQLHAMTETELRALITVEVERRAG